MSSVHTRFERTPVSDAPLLGLGSGAAQARRTVARLIVGLRTAKVHEVEISRSVPVRADQLIECVPEIVAEFVRLKTDVILVPYIGIVEACGKRTQSTVCALTGEAS